MSDMIQYCMIEDDMAGEDTFFWLLKVFWLLTHDLAN